MDGTDPNAAVRIGRWILSSVPASWFYVPGFGLRHNSPYPTSNITVKEDVLLAGNKLQPYVDAQITILKRTYLDPSFAGPQPIKLLAQAEETMLLLIRHQPLNGVSVMQVQTYARVANWLGIITLTTVEQSVTSLRRDYEQFVQSLAIASEPGIDSRQTASPAAAGAQGR